MDRPESLKRATTWWRDGFPTLDPAMRAKFGAGAPMELTIREASLFVASSGRVGWERIAARLSMNQ